MGPVFPALHDHKPGGNATPPDGGRGMRGSDGDGGVFPETPITVRPSSRAT